MCVNIKQTNESLLFLCKAETLVSIQDGALCAAFQNYGLYTLQWLSVVPGG